MPRKRKHGEKLIAQGYAIYPSMLDRLRRLCLEEIKGLGWVLRFLHSTMISRRKDHFPPLKVQDMATELV